MSIRRYSLIATWFVCLSVVASCTPATVPTTIAPTNVSVIATTSAPAPTNIPSATIPAVAIPSQVPLATLLSTDTPLAMPRVTPTIAAQPTTPSISPTSTQVAAPVVPTTTRPTASPTTTPTQVNACVQDPAAMITRILSQNRIADFSKLVVLQGTVYLYGTANKPDLQYSKIEFSADKKTWVEIGTQVKGITADSYYGAWQTTNVTDGDYWLRLLVVDKTGNYAEPQCPIRVTVSNKTASTPSAGDCKDPNAVITNPQSDQTLSGSINIYGSANRDNFSYFKLQLSSDRKNWEDLRVSSVPVTGDALVFYWNSRLVSNGDYWLRLLVVDKTGNYNQPCEYHIVVKN